MNRIILVLGIKGPGYRCHLILVHDWWDKGYLGHGSWMFQTRKNYRKWPKRFNYFMTERPKPRTHQRLLGTWFELKALGISCCVTLFRQPILALPSRLQPLARSRSRSAYSPWVTKADNTTSGRGTSVLSQNAYSQLHCRHQPLNIIMKWQIN